MSKDDKKKQRLLEQIQKLETDMKLAITKKASDKKEISISDYQRKIKALKDQL